jgi:hypothetical protein
MNEYRETERGYASHLATQRQLQADKKIRRAWIVEVSAWIIVTALLTCLAYLAVKA